MTFRALLLTQEEKATEARLVELEDDDLPVAGNVEVQVAYSTLNYKDALAITGRGAIVKTWPMVPGIDLAGEVVRSDDPAWPAGTPVVVNGWGLGETHWGGLAQKARVSSDWLTALPAPFDARQAMAIGTAGFTAALCVMALQRHGLEAGDPVLVTGAAGGVGSVSVMLLSALGYEVSASTGRPSEADHLRDLGATHIVERQSLSSPGRPLQSERWAGVVDTVGSHTLANACAGTRWHGAVAACGLAQGSDFPATVMPFILRAVTLYGINCVFTPHRIRDAAWALLARHVSLAQLDALTQEVSLDECLTASADLLDGRRRGRTVVSLD